MKEFYFTFGQDHVTKEGIPMHNSWVTVTASDYDKAREIFIKKFMIIYMERVTAFSFQYSSMEELAPSYYKNGEFIHIS